MKQHPPIPLRISRKQIAGSCAIILAIVLLFESGPGRRVLALIGFRYSSDEKSSFYDAMVTCHLRMQGNVPPGAVLFFGDSITQGLCVAAVAEKGVNFGIGNDTTVGLKYRLPLYTSIERSRAVVLEIGVNDLKRSSNAEIIKNWRDILGILPKKIPVIMTAIFPVDETVRTRPTNARIVSLNRQLARICRGFRNCIFLDTAEKLKDASGNLQGRYHTGDGIHLNSRGYGLWIRDIRLKLSTIYH